YNCKIINDRSKIQTVEYLSPVNDSPTSRAVVQETLNIAKKVAQNCHQEQIIATYDLAIAKLAMQIQYTQKPEFDTIFINLGAFHMKMAYFKAIGKYIESSGLMEILVEAEALAGGSTDSFLDSKHFNRCKRLHPLLSGASQVLHFEEYLFEAKRSVETLNGDSDAENGNNLYDSENNFETLNENLETVTNTSCEVNERFALRDSLQKLLEDYKKFRENCFDSDYIDEPLEPVLEDSNIELIFDDAEEETVTFENNQNDIFQRSESSKATRKFKRPLPRYVEQDQTDVACKIQIDQSPKNNTANAQETWAEWTPTKLKKPLSTELTGRAEQKQMKKTKLTEDCRQKIKKSRQEEVVPEPLPVEVILEEFQKEWNPDHFIKNGGIGQEQRTNESYMKEAEEFKERSIYIIDLDIFHNLTFLVVERIFENEETLLSLKAEIDSYSQISESEYKQLNSRLCHISGRINKLGVDNETEEIGKKLLRLEMLELEGDLAAEIPGASSAQTSPPTSSNQQPPHFNFLKSVLPYK
ncbi:hypothetical protein JTB14_017048, partial [Gonioctena quinquepunctata]